MDEGGKESKWSKKERGNEGSKGFGCSEGRNRGRG